MSDAPKSRISSWAQHASEAGSVFAVVCALAVLAGWALGAGELRTLFLGQTAMRPNSALAYLLAGLALWMVQEAPPGVFAQWRLRHAGKVLAGLVVAVGALTLAEYLSGVGLGIDQLLFHDRELSPAGLFPGRMTPTGAVSLLFLGCALLWLDGRKRRGSQPAEVLAFVVILNGMLGMFDFLVHYPSTLTGIAPPSAMMQCVLGGSLLMARSDHRFRKLVFSTHSGGTVFRRLLPAAVVIPLLLASLVWQGDRLGIFSNEIGLTLLVVMTSTAFVWIVMRTTGSLDESDRARRAAAAELDVRLEQQAAIVRLGHRALKGTALPELMDQTVSLVARTLGVEFSKVQELLPDGKSLVLRAGVGWELEQPGPTVTEAHAGSQGGFTLMSDRPVIVEDLGSEDRFQPSPLLARHGVVSGLSVIVSGKERPFGVLGAHSRERRHFSQDDVNFLQAVANILAAAIDRKRTEKDLGRTNRSLRTLSECNLTMVRATTEQELIEKVCRIMVEQGGYRMAWVGYAEHDEAKTVRPAAVAGAEEGYLAGAKITWGDDKHGHGPTGTAIRTGWPHVVRDILQDENFAPWREDARQHGYASTAALPLLVNGRVLGALRVYSKAPDAFDDEEVKLLSELAADLSYGIQALRTRAERARAARAWQESEEKFRQMAENIREALWMVDAATAKVLYESPSYETVWGQRAGALESLPLGWLEALHPGDRHRVREAMGGNIPRRAFEAEFRVVWPDGAVHWVRDRSLPVRGAGGEVGRLVGVSEDITERRLAEEALLESEERFRQLFNEMNAGCALFELTRDARGLPSDAPFLEVNPAFERLTGLTRHGIIGKGLVEIFPEVRHWLGRLGRVALTGESTRFEDYFPALDKYFDVTAFRPRAGQFAAVFADITERRQAQQAIEEAERKYRSIFENAMEGIFQVRGDGGLVTANRAMARLLGYESAEEFLREACNFENHLYVEPRHPSGFMTLLRQQGSISDFETQMQRKDGRVIWVMGSAYAVRDDAGRVRYYEGTLRDISEHKKAEESLRQLSAQLLHAQDDERRRIARELHDSTGQYLAALAMNLSWLSQSCAASEPQVSSVVGESIDLVKRALSEVRNFSYLLHPPVLDEYGLAAALQWYVQGFSQRSGIAVELDLEEGLPRLTRDAETALFRVVQESLTNVHRHSGSSTAKIRLRREAGNLILDVSDQGHGVTFMSAETGAGSARVGVGIAGLKERMRELGGWLEMESNSHGTLVHSSLPLELKEVVE